MAMSSSTDNTAKKLTQLTVSSSDALGSGKELRLKRLPKLRELDSKPSLWNGTHSETVHGIFQTKIYLTDSDFILDPYTSSNPAEGSFGERYRYSVRGIIRDALQKKDGFKKSYEDLLHNQDTALRDIDYSNYSFEEDPSFLSAVGARLASLRRFGAKKKVMAKPPGKKKKKTTSGSEQDISSSSSVASDVNNDNASVSQVTSSGDGLSDYSAETVGLGRFFNFVVSLERILKERLTVKELSAKYFFRTFSDFVQAVFMDGNPSNDVFIYDLIQPSCLTFYSPVDSHQLLVQSDADLIIQQDDGHYPQKTVAVVQCKCNDKPLRLKCEERCFTPEVKSDDEEFPHLQPESKDSSQKSGKQQEALNRLPELPKELDAELCRFLTSSESQELDNILPQCIGDIFTSFDQPSIFEKRIDPEETYKNKSYRLGISVLGLRVMFVAIVIVDPKSRGKPHPTLLPGSVHRKLGMRTDVFVTRQFDLMNFDDRKSLAKILISITQFDKVFKR